MALVPAAASSPRRLLAVSPVAAPGGAEMALVRFLRRLDPERWRPVIASPAGDGVPDLARDHGWPWRELDCGPLPAGPRNAARGIASWPRARALARDSDVVYLNGAVTGRLLPAVRRLRRNRPDRRDHHRRHDRPSHHDRPGRHDRPSHHDRPSRHSHPVTVLHVHDLVRRVPPMWRTADLRLVPTEAVSHRLAPLSCHVVGCPIELDPPHEAPPPWPERAEANGPVIGFVGRFEPRKGPLDLIRAAPLIRRAQPAARVVLVGGDPYAGDPDYLARVHAEGGSVECYSWARDGAALMCHLDVLVLPSHEEPFGTVLAEAMAVGTPVVATRVGGLPEVVPDGIAGLLVPPGDPPALAGAVLTVLARRDELAAGAREAARRFDADRYARRVETLILDAGHSV